MNRAEVLARAESFLNKKKINYVKPGEFGEQGNRRIEVIFMRPEANNPDVVIDPPDVRVWVDIYNGEVELIEQM